MSDDCSAEYNIGILQNMLRPASMNLLLRRRQQDEVRNAQLDNMESCPFCDFAMVIENSDEKVFKCQNPECLRESCRLVFIFFLGVFLTNFFSENAKNQIIFHYDVTKWKRMLKLECELTLRIKWLKRGLGFAPNVTKGSKMC